MQLLNVWKGGYKGKKRRRNLSKKEIYPPFILLIKIWKRNSNILIVNEFLYVR